MATLYITTNADSGSGSLRALIASASAGDVIQPDETAFPPGTICKIAVASYYRIETAVTIRGAQTRIEFNGGGNTGSQFQIRAPLTFEDVDFIELAKTGTGGTLWAYAAGSGTSFTRCTFAGCAADQGGALYVATGVNITARDCLFIGNKATTAGGAICFIDSTPSGSTIENCTIVGNVSGNDTEVTGTGYGGGNNKTTTTGMVNPPSIALATWTYDAWRAWNCRLLSTSETDATGASATTSTTDLDGNARRAGGAIGAYEAVAGVTWTSGSGGVVSLSGATVGTFYGANITTINLTGVNVWSLLSLTGNASITFTNGAALGVETLLTGTYTATLSGTGYLATTPGTTLTNVVDATGAEITRSAYGAGVSSFLVTAVDETTVTLSGTQIDANTPVLVEYQDSSHAWQTLASAVTLSANGVSKTVPRGVSVFRVYDGVSFTVDETFSGIPLGVQFSVTSCVVSSSETGQNWDCIFEVIAVDDDNRVRVGQAITILARVFDAFDDSAPLVNTGSNIEKVSYTCARKTKEIFTNVWEPVEGHTDVEIDDGALLEGIVTSDAWTKDEDGFNFSFTPDTTENPLFPETGEYRIVITIELTTGNPVVFYVFVSVVDDLS